MKILLAEDDKFLGEGLSMILRDNGYAVDLVMTGPEADLALSVAEYDLLILDLGLPKMDGLEVMRRARSRACAIPILILTARDGLEDRVAGLDLGANDYIGKPFELPELEARIRALLRKDLWSNRMEVSFSKLHFNTLTRVATIDGQPLELSARELSVLECLLQRLGRLVNKDQLAASMSSWDEDLSYNALGITIHRLRKKLEPFGITVRAVRGLGYRLETGET